MRLEAVGKRYGVRQPWVVRDVSVDLPAGRLIRVEGRNGSGKSTLLRIVAGVTAASAGRVTGRPARTGYVPERFPGGLPFTGREYLLHLARVHGLRGAAGGRAVDEWLERLGAAAYASQPLASLSKGMCQKIAITQALLPRPGLLVLDEAWTGLDQAARGALDAAATERAAAGGTVLIVDHDPARLAGHADERWRLEAGGRFTALPGDNTSAGPGRSAPGDGAPAEAAAGDTAVTIELAGVEGGSLSRLAGLPGVLACAGAEPTADPGTDPRTDPARAGRAVVRVTANHSDDMLREVLAWDGVRVVSVRPEKAGNQ
jgi:ABC-2 type transport system ATP-binding protein